jgi:cardiolipin synthase
MEWWSWVVGAWGFLVAGVTVAGAIVASGHAILYKRDTRATVLWVGFIWLAPLAGPICYLLLGINRIKRKASLLRRSAPRLNPGDAPGALGAKSALPPVAVAQAHFARLVHVVDSVVEQSLLPGNRIEPLFNGDEAFPAMLSAIDQAKGSIVLCSYIFDRDAIGKRFVAALAGAVRRGVEVRVLVDDTGARYSFPTIVGSLRKAGVPVARFLPTLAPFKTFALNMRSHRKLMIVDGRLGFTGGMNIRAGNMPDATGRRRIRDTHFRVEGPVVAHMRSVFADDWLFTTGERLDGEIWAPSLVEVGPVWARGIADGPDEALDRLRWAVLGGLACAHERICIFTPYFLPDPGLISALNTAALRGISVEVAMPENNNLRFVQWAATAHFWQVLERGCRLFLVKGEFDHSKVMVVDRQWTFVGSSNWDPRSMRLNFEFDVESYCPDFAGRMTDWFDGRLADAREVTLEAVNGRPLWQQLRDGVARLATPFL